MQLNQVQAAIDAYFSDTSRSQSETHEGLMDIIEYAQSRIEALEEDMGEPE